MSPCTIRHARLGVGAKVMGLCEAMDAADERLESLAKAGYGAYGTLAEWKNFEGKPMPQWGELRPDIRDKWVAATRAILDEYERVR